MVLELEKDNNIRKYEGLSKISCIVKIKNKKSKSL